MPDPAFTPDERARILAELIQRRARGETFRAIAATPGFPSRPTLRKWLRRRPDLHVPPLRRPPVRWSAALSREICRRVLNGESVRAICADPAMPDRKSLHAWARARPGFAARLADARERSGAPAVGRPSRFRLTRAALVNDIYLRLCRGDTLDQACAAGPDRPNRATLYGWRRNDREVDRVMLLGARIGAETRADARLPDLRAYFAGLEAFVRELRAKAAADDDADPKPPCRRPAR